MQQLTTDADPRKRIKKFLRSYRNAPGGMDIAMKIGRVAETGESAVLIGIGKTMHAFTVEEARHLADVAEDALRKYPQAAESEGIPDLIIGLRYAADQAEKSRPRCATTT